LTRYLCFLLLIAFCSCTDAFGPWNAMVIQGDIVYLDSTGVTFTAKILNPENLDEYDCGFVWSNKEYPILNKDECVYTDKVTKEGFFSARASAYLRKGVQYHVRAFVKTSRHISYSSAADFMAMGSIPPEITAFSPDTGNVSENMVLHGHRFSNRADSNLVFFGNRKAEVLSYFQDSLVVKVPPLLNLQQVRIRVYNGPYYADSKKTFNLYAPITGSIDKTEGTWGDTLALQGNNFNCNPTTVQVYVGSYRARIINRNNHELDVVVPDSLNENSCSVRVVMNNIWATYAQSFHLKPFTLMDFSPKTALTGALITIKGTHFCPVASMNKVRIGGLTASIISCKSNELIVYLPLQKDSMYEGRNAQIQVQLGELENAFQTRLLINDKWFRRKNYPSNIYSIGTYGSIGDSFEFYVSGSKAYGGIYTKKEFWSYDPETDNWTKKANFPGTLRYGGSGFSLGGKIYFGTGNPYTGDNAYLNDFWKYDIVSDTWTKLNNFKAGGRTGTVAFTFKNKGYMGSGQSTGGFESDFWKYDETLDTWTSITRINNSYVTRSKDNIAVVAPDYVFLSYGYNDSYPKECNAYEFVPDVTWKIIPDAPYYFNFLSDGIHIGTGFCIQDTVFLHDVSSSIFKKYIKGQSSTQQWKSMETNILGNMDNCKAFKIGTIVFVALPKSCALWEYDPNR
jgi:hypothetical protein